jgi:hypothetical protein
MLVQLLGNVAIVFSYIELPIILEVILPAVKYLVPCTKEKISNYVVEAGTIPW